MATRTASFLGLEGTHCLVTGANGGIGLATAEELLGNGAKVTLHYRTGNDKVQELQRVYGASRVFLVQADVRQEKQVRQAMAAAVAKLGPVAVLVANHGIWPTEAASIADMSLERWNNTMAVNLTGVFLWTSAYLTQLRQHASKLPEASVVIVGSTAGEFGEAQHADYATTKAALHKGFLLSLKNEIVTMHPRGRANCIAPGWVATPMAREALKNTEYVAQVFQTTPMRKVGLPEDIARSVAFLASGRAAGHITGQVIVASGGMEGRVLYSTDQALQLQARAAS